MKFVPRTEEEIRIMMIWPDGEYEFDILKSEEKVSKSGNEMIEILIKIYNKQGRTKLITDYLLNNDDDKMIFKIRHLCSSLGLIDEYNSGELKSHKFLGKSGKVIIKTQKDKLGNYPDKNVVKDYLVKEFVDNDLPF